MKLYEVNTLMKQLKRAQIERVVNCGFEDGALYNDELLKLTDVDLQKFKELKGIIGATKAMPKSADVNVNNQGFTDEEYDEKERLELKKKKKTLTPQEQARLDELKKRRTERQSAISILRGISIRMPLLIYGADIKDEDRELDINNFTQLIDDTSWKEFMPRGVTKERFNDFKQYYEADIFREAGKRIREIIKAADNLTVEECIERITMLFNTFRNPDKETVLTPWRVVNMHLGDCLGGECFYDEHWKHTLSIPRRIDQGEVTDNVFSPDSRVLEINSKSGLYPLYVAYNIYRSRVEAMKQKYGEVGHGFARQIWDATIADNIFVVCKTPMAESITRRTLLGCRQVEKCNIVYYPDLVNQIKTDPIAVVNNIRDGKHFWNINNDEHMKFNAIVGNPPYQVMDGGAGASATPIYNRFVSVAKEINPNYITLITPARWYYGGKGLDEFRKDMLSDKHILILHDFIDSAVCFNNVEIKGGLCYFLWDSRCEGKCHICSHNADNTEIIHSERFLKDEDDLFIRDSRLLNIKNKIEKYGYKSLKDMVSAMKPYGLRGDFFKDQAKYGLPEIENKHKDGYITIYGLDERQHRVKRYIQSTYPLPKRDGIDFYKIFMPRNFGSGQYDDCVYTSIVAQPNEICTETFVQIYPFENYYEVQNCNKYLKTKFVRILFCIRKQDQGAGREVYRYIPLQDFTDKSDIDWSKSVKEIDKQLYKKYELSEKEMAFIEKMMKPMA